MPTSLSSSASRKVRGHAPVSTRSGTRVSLTKDRPLEPLMTSSAVRAGTPAFTSAASPSPTARMFTARNALFTALSASPAPIGPTCTIRLPISARTGRARSNVGSSAPTMIVRVPASAPLVPPLTGASANPTARAARRAAIRRDPAGSPEVQSIRSAPVARPARSPSGPSRSASTSREVGRQVTTTAAPSAASRGVAALRTSCALANASALARVRFQTVSREPRASRAAIGAPMAPSPRKAAGPRLTSGPRPAPLPCSSAGPARDRA